MQRIHRLHRWHEPACPTPRWRRRLVQQLRSCSLTLAHLAERLARVAARPQRAPELEFYAEAGAPEGALYSDGKLIGLLPGVTRL